MKTRLLTYLFFIILIFKYDYIFSQNPEFISTPIESAIGNQVYTYDIKATDDIDLSNLKYTEITIPYWATFTEFSETKEMFEGYPFTDPRGIAIDDFGNIYISDYGANKIVIWNKSTEVISTIGSGTAGWLDGDSTIARFNGPYGLHVHGGYLYVADSKNNRIRAIAIGSRIVSTIAGSGIVGSNNSGDDNQIGSSAKFDTPNDIFVTNDGTIYVADTENRRIRIIQNNTDRTVSTHSQVGYHVQGIVIDETNSLIYYSTHQNGIFKSNINPAFGINTPFYTGGEWIYGIELYGDKNLYASLNWSGTNPPNEILRVNTSNSTDEEYINTGNVNNPYHMAVDKTTGCLVIVGENNLIQKVTTGARIMGIPPLGDAIYPVEIKVTDSDNNEKTQNFNIYVDEKGPKIVSLDPEIGTINVDTKPLLRITFDKEVKVNSGGSWMSILDVATQSENMFISMTGYTDITNTWSMVSIDPLDKKVLLIDLSYHSLTRFEIKPNTKVYLKIDAGFVVDLRGNQFEGANDTNDLYFTTKPKITDFDNITETYTPTLEIPLSPIYNNGSNAILEIIKDSDGKVVRYDDVLGNISSVPFINEPTVLSTGTRTGNLDIGDAGIFKVKVTIPNDINFYGATKEIYVTINKANPTISLKPTFPINITYGDSNIELTQYIETSSDGIKSANMTLINETSIVNNELIIGSASPTTNIGFDIMTSSTNNYNVSSNSNNFTIAKKVLEVKVEYSEREYLATDPLTFVSEFIGFKDGDNESSLTGSATYDSTTYNSTSSLVGFYDILVSGYTSNNYTFDYTAPFGKLKVTKRSPNLTAGNFAVDYTASTTSNSYELFDLASISSVGSTGTYSYSIEGDSGENLTNPVRGSKIIINSNSSATFESGNAGVVVLKITIAEDNNYKEAFVDITITINKIEPSISFIIIDPDYGDNIQILQILLISY